MKPGDSVVCLKSEFPDWPFEEGEYLYVEHKRTNHKWATPMGVMNLDDYDNLMGFPYYVRQVFKFKENK